MPRKSDDVLLGGGRVFLNNQEIGWLQGEFQLEEQGDATVIKESEGATVLTLNLDKETHFTFNLLEANLDTLRMLNPSYTRIVEGDETKTVSNEYIADISKSNGLKHIPMVIDTTNTVTVRYATELESVDDTKTIITVGSVTHFTAGDGITIIQGSRTETATIDSIDTSTGEITLTAELANTFTSGATVINTTADTLVLGTDFYLYPGLGLITRVPSSTAVAEGDSVVVSYSYHQYKGKGYGMGSFESDETYKLEFWHKKRSGQYRVIRMFKARLAGNFTAFLLNQDSESPIPIDVTLIADETIADSKRNTYEQIDYISAEAAPGGGW